jgi:hypothetical protein
VTLVGGLVLVLLGTAGSVIAAILYNLISDLVGGIELVMLEEEVPARSVATPSAQVASVEPISDETVEVPAGPEVPAEANGAAATGRVTSVRSGL